MSTAKPFTILHLSDAHIGNPKYKLEATEVLDRLVTDLDNVANERQLTPDLIVFSGDLAYGQLPGNPIATQFEQAKQWLERIYSTLGLSTAKVPLAMVPGNHDRNLETITEGDINWIRGIKQGDPTKVNESMESGDLQWRRFLQPQAEWADFVRRFCGDVLRFDETIHTSTLVIDHGTKKIGLAALNSSWACHKEGEGENGKIWIGEVQIRRALDTLKGCSFKIAVSHHPVGWLESSQRSWTKERIETEFDLHLYGHEHSAWVEDHADHLKVAAGPCYDGALKARGYSWIVIDFVGREAHVHLREYQQKGRGGWIPLVIPGKSDTSGIVAVRALFPGGVSGSSGPPNRRRPVPVSHSVPAPFNALKDVPSYVKALEEHFGFRWEPLRFHAPSQRSVVVYWPVRLRTPTLIHAVQCFAAAGLQRSGAKIVLCLDDLGNPEARPETFEYRANEWFRVAGGDHEAIQRLSFKTVITRDEAAKIWAKVQTWLGSTEFLLEKILRISKLNIAH